MLAHVDAAHVLTADAVDERDAALPTHALLLGARKRLAVELEIRGIEVAVQHACAAHDRVHTRPQLQVVELGVAPELVETGEE